MNMSEMDQLTKIFQVLGTPLITQSDQEATLITSITTTLTRNDQKMEEEACEDGNWNVFISMILTSEICT